jgi:L-lactate dehydrogenase complex protein LldE
MNIAGRIQRRGLNIKVRHAAEVLADMADAPAIGEPLDKG